MDAGSILRLVIVVASSTLGINTFAQQSVEESLALSIHPDGVGAFMGPRVFIVNPGFETLQKSSDERFEETFEIPENFLIYLAHIVGDERDSEITIEEYLAGLEESGRRVVLSADTPHIEGKAWLTLENASSVNPSQGIVFDGPDRGSLSVDLKVKGGNKYSILFFIDSLGPGIFKVEVGSDEHQHNDTMGKFRSIAVQLNALTDGWTRIDFERTFGVGFMLYEVDVITTELQ